MGRLRFHHEQKGTPRPAPLAEKRMRLRMNLMHHHAQHLALSPFPRRSHIRRRAHGSHPLPRQTKTRELPARPTLQSPSIQHMPKLCPTLDVRNYSHLTKSMGSHQTRLLPAWPPGDDIAATTHWIPSFFAVQMDLSDAILTTKSKVLSMDGDVLPLATTLPAAFLHARAAGPEQFILDRDVPPLDSRSDGIPKLAKGAFQELMVETVADGHVRVSYVSAEVSTCWQAVRREQERGLTRLSRFLYELHVMYAQSLLAGAARQLIIMTSFSRPPRSDASRLRGATPDLIWPLTTSSLSTLRSHPSLQPPPPPSPSSQLIEPAHHGISLPRAPPR